MRLYENLFQPLGAVVKVRDDVPMLGVCSKMVFSQERYNAIINTQLDAARSAYSLMVHPLDAPFVKALLLGRLPEATISRLWNECGRKYEMGAKRGIAKWGLRELIAQYEARLGQ